jgi:geranylgeranyl diphosphate synthase type II
MAYAGKDRQWNDFGSFAAEHRDIVYEKIVGYLDIEAPEEFSKMLRCYIERKGQYRRPMYTILWDLLYGGNADDAILPAAAQQLSEDYFLMHDDWMDGNETRRGLPAAHVLYGPIYAVDAGDTLQNILWKIVADTREALGGERGKRYFDKFYDIMLTTHVGQYLDLSLTKDHKNIKDFTREDYFRSIHAKSAYYSVYGPMQCGAIIAGAEGSKVDGIKGYGTLAGMAFQIKDDILDCTSTREQLGKTIGNDVREGTKTIILWHAVHNCDSATLKRLEDVYAKPRELKSEEDVAFVLRKFDELGSVRFAEKEAEAMSGEALAMFEKESAGIKESNIKRLARESIAHTTKRKK